MRRGRNKRELDKHWERKGRKRRKERSKHGLLAAVIFFPNWSSTSEVNPDALYGHSYWVSNWKLEISLCPLNTAMLWGIMGHQGGPKPTTYSSCVWFEISLSLSLSLSVCVCRSRMYLLICPAALHSTWKYILRLVPDRWLGPRLVKHKLGDVSCQLLSLFAQR